MDGGNGKIRSSSSEAISEAAAATFGSEEVESDGNPPEEQEQQWRHRAHTSPDVLRHFRATRTHGQHVCFSEQRRNGV